jgi:uncharacterized protein (TIGR02145 family)
LIKKRKTKMRYKKVNLFAVTLFCIGLTGLQAQTVKDIDGNVYNTVTIGTQVWLKENLKTTKYNDGTAIPNITDAAAWGALTTPAYCWYDNDAATYKATYGALYNWYAVNTGKLCPTGWHVASAAEWGTLIDYLDLGRGSERSVAADKLKEAGMTHWGKPNDRATNESGFTALPGGFRTIKDSKGSFWWVGGDGIWWTSTDAVEQTEYFKGNALYILMYCSYSYVGGSFAGKNMGHSVRCIRDN